jgi:hypothetical protein
MASNTIDDKLNALEQAIAAKEVEVELLNSSVERLLTTAFASKDIYARFQEQERHRGSNRALAIALGKDTLPRSLWFGPLKGSFLQPGARAEAQDALGKLSSVVEKLNDERGMLKDLETTRERLIIGHDRERTRETIEKRTREKALDRTNAKKRDKKKDPTDDS